MSFPQPFDMVMDEGMTDPLFTEMMSDPQFTYKPVPTPVLIYENAKTSVFWDMAGYPIPNGVDPVLFCGVMKNALVNQGYKGELSIYLYVDTGELLPNGLETCVEFDFLPEGDDYARISSMLVDISFWALSYPYSNIIVLSKNIVRGTIVAFESLYNTHGLLLSKTEPDWLVPGERSTLFLTSLFEDPTGGQLSTSSQKQRKIQGGGGTSSQGAKRVG
ncbi:unnamed protein product [Brassica oleracea var. botrytis]|uniref:BnaC03g21430D protein n=4 Tax=Brassica TaxID=3705 RepID=A0A078FNK7_BRANA|nr:PREDICTED: uncharacterized protein LOC106331316 [Brassica oleracea var. oleracea]XP_013707124.1 uncharacterized protein BNAC03G21430D [Brassica napus]VDC89597.1 unnamed protein product [Brassica oleracea]KAH0889688.1 hypothetical protein HID58_052117 [Brassica napus]CAF1700546.1 unnamed protein product [Brassica napus]CDY14452.1 BnaC03g21430D [Brassica napus]